MIFNTILGLVNGKFGYHIWYDSWFIASYLQLEYQLCHLVFKALGF